MRFVFASLAILAVLSASPAIAEEPAFAPLPLLDLEAVSPELAADMFGRWTVADESGGRNCGVELLREMAIGGMQIAVDPACETVFPVMADIAAWQLREGWTIDFVDGERKTRIRFSTPDERYVAFPEVDGIATIAPE